MRARAASGSFAPAATPAENTVMRCSSAGSGPTISMPSIGMSSLELLEADLGVAAGDDAADPLAHDLAALRHDAVAAGKARQDLARKVDAAGARRIGDRLGLEEGALVNASTVEMSGFGAPARTAIAIDERARSTRLPGMALPSVIIRSSAGAAMMSTSAGSPRASRIGMASGAVPIEAPQAVATVFPVVRSQPGARSL